MLFTFYFQSAGVTKVQGAQTRPTVRLRTCVSPKETQVGTLWYCQRPAALSTTPGFSDTRISLSLHRQPEKREGSTSFEKTTKINSRATSPRTSCSWQAAEGRERSPPELPGPVGAWCHLGGLGLGIWPLSSGRLGGAGSWHKPAHWIEGCPTWLKHC